MLRAPENNRDFETAAGATGVTIPFKDILTNPSFGFMGEIYLHWKWLGLVAKGMYLDLNPNGVGTGFNLRPIVGDVDLNIGLEMGMYDFGLSWKLWRNLRLFTLGRVAQVAVQGRDRR